ncbi:MAG TPA: FkbM family methyltransferase [Polyangiales bacterium]|jgi:FkbM family methyltransferase
MEFDPDRVTIDGQYGVFEGSARDRVVLDEYRRIGSWAPELVELIARRLFAADGGTFIDVGANIGLVSIPVLERSRAIGIAFEPEPRNFEFLSRNVARHGLQARLGCHRLACHEANGRLPLALSSDNLGDHRLQRTAADGARATIEVETVRLDDVLRGRELSRPIAIKVDAQGSEVSVFAGAAETLARADYVVSEYWPEGIVAHGDSADRFAEIMRGFPFGAVLHVLPLPEPLHPSRYVFEQLSWIAHDGSDPGFFDLLFSRHLRLPTSPA